MSLLISKYFNNPSIINTTADYNLCYYIDSLKNPIQNIVKLTIEELNIILKKNDLINFIQKKYNFQLKNIVFFDLHHKIQIDKYNCLKNINIYLYVIDDHHDIRLGLPKYNDFITNNQLKLLCCYAYNLGSCNPIHNKIKENIFFPHSVIHKIEINNNPITKILACGRGFKNIQRYPYRNKIYKLSLINKNIEYLRSKSSYRGNPNLTSKGCWGNNFIKTLNKYLIVFCDEANINTNCAYIIAKFFEIMSAGCLLLTYNPHTEKFFDKLGFIKNQHYIYINLQESNEQIFKNINEILHKSNREKIDEIRNNAYKKVWEYHSSEARFNYLLNILNNTQKLIEYTDGIKNTKYLYKKSHP